MQLVKVSSAVTALTQCAQVIPVTLYVCALMELLLRGSVAYYTP